MEPLAGRTVAVTADRRWEEQADLLRRRGASVVHGPTMVTVDLTEEPALRAITEAIVAEPPQWLVVTTGAGFRLWRETAATWSLDEALVSALREASTAIVCRGAKGASAVRAAGLTVSWRAEHESMDEVVAHVREAAPPGSSLAVQLFDPDDHWSTVQLRERFPSLVEIPVYRWRMPDDVEPARRLVRAVVDGGVDAVTFTSQPAVRFLFVIADDLGLGERLRDALSTRVLAVCVGPVCAEALVECGVDHAVWPDPPRLVPMVKLVEQQLSSPSSPS